MVHKIIQTGKIIGGDAPFVEGTFIGIDAKGNLLAAFQNLAGKVESVEIVTEDNKHSIAGKLGWGTIGLVALGPVGALAGILLGGRKKEICFACYLRNGKKFLAVADSDTYKKLLAISFKRKSV